MKRTSSGVLLDLVPPMRRIYRASPALYNKIWIDEHTYYVCYIYKPMQKAMEMNRQWRIQLEWTAKKLSMFYLIFRKISCEMYFYGPDRRYGLSKQRKSLEIRSLTADRTSHCAHHVRRLRSYWDHALFSTIAKKFQNMIMKRVSWQHICLGIRTKKWFSQRFGLK